MANYTDDLALIVRYDGTKAAFEQSDKSGYLGKVVFIYGSKDEVTNQVGLVQAIWVSDETGGRYLDMANVDTIKEGMTHIAGLATEGAVKILANGANGINFKGANGISITFNPSNSTDQNGVPYWNVEISGQGVIDTIKGVSTDSVNTLTLHGVKNYAQSAANTAKNEVIGQDTDTESSDTIKGAKKYADKVKTDLEGTKAEGDTTAQTIEGAKKYADAVATSKASAAKDAAIQESKSYVDDELENKADLENGKIPIGQLPDAILGQMLFGGTIEGGTATQMTVAPTANLLNKIGKTDADLNADGYLVITNTSYKTYEGVYFISSINFDNVNVVNIPDVRVGDWIISTGASWRKVDNTDAVASVAGLTGVITASALAQKLAETGDANELALKSELTWDNVKPDDGIPEGDLATEVQEALAKANTAITSLEGSDYIAVGRKAGGTIQQQVVTAKTAEITSETAPTDGLATVADIRAYLAARLSVKVVS